jgi:hypothetical protein
MNNSISECRFFWRPGRTSNVLVLERPADRPNLPFQKRGYLIVSAWLEGSIKGPH